MIQIRARPRNRRRRTRWQQRGGDRHRREHEHGKRVPEPPGDIEQRRKLDRIERQIQGSLRGRNRAAASALKPGNHDIEKRRYTDDPHRPAKMQMHPQNPVDEQQRHHLTDHGQPAHGNQCTVVNRGGNRNLRENDGFDAHSTMMTQNSSDSNHFIPRGILRTEKRLFINRIAAFRTPASRETWSQEIPFATDLRYGPGCRHPEMPESRSGSQSCGRGRYRKEPD